MEDLDVNAAIWVQYHSSSSSSSWSRLWGEFDDSSRIISGHLWNSCSKKLENWVAIRQKSLVWPRLITKSTHGDRQVYCVTELIRSRMPRPTSSPTLCSVWRKVGDDPSANWKSKVKWIWIESTECRWSSSGNYSQDSQRWASEKIQSLMRDLQCEPEHFNDRIIFMSMYNDIVWQERGNTERCEYNSQTVANDARRFPRGRWSLGPGSEKKLYGTYSDNPTEPGTKLPNKWCWILQDHERKFEQLSDEQKISKLLTLVWRLST